MADVVTITARPIYLEDLAIASSPGQQDTNVPVAGYGPATLTRVYFNTSQLANKVTPSGAVNGVNTVFVLPDAPSPPESLQLFRNGILQDQGTDYTLAGDTITFSATAPLTGDSLRAWYTW